jgi:hypothetical protein
MVLMVTLVRWRGGGWLRRRYWGKLSSTLFLKILPKAVLVVPKEFF